MNVQQIFEIVNEYAPFSIAMENDNAGLLVGRSDSEVTGVLVTLDADISAMQHALKLGYNTIISHHPILFKGENSLTGNTPQGSKLLFAIENHLNIICAHTNLDACENGVNDTLGIMLKFKTADSFIPTQNGGYLGRIGTHEFESKEAFLKHAAQTLNTIPRFRFCNDRFERIAWVSGSGAAYLKDAAAAGADTFITGDVKYSNFMDAAQLGINLIDLGHFETERLIVPIIGYHIKMKDIEMRIHYIENPIQTWR